MFKLKNRDKESTDNNESEDQTKKPEPQEDTKKSKLQEKAQEPKPQSKDKKPAAEIAEKMPDEFEEVSEKPTSALGFSLLVLMMALLIGISQKVFNNLALIRQRPEPPAMCLEALGQENYMANLLDRPICSFGEVDEKFGLKEEYRILGPGLDRVLAINAQIRSFLSQIETFDKELVDLVKQYDLSLAAESTEVPPEISSDEIKSQIVVKQSQVEGIRSQAIVLTQERDQELQGVSALVQSLNQSYREARAYYGSKHLYYQLELFLLKLLFIFPFFVISIILHFRLKRKRSHNRIIWTAVLISAVLLVAQALVMFLYAVLPTGWIGQTVIFYNHWIAEIYYLKYIVYSVAAILVIVICGLFVWMVQRKMFDPRKMGLRRIKDNKCPNCGFTHTAEHIFCPRCGDKIRGQCHNCEALNILYLPFCPHCGKE